MKKKSVIIKVSLLLAMVDFCSNATAYELPALNLGLTSFIDGVPPSGPGVYFMQYLQTYDGQLKDKRGHSLQLPKHEVEVDLSVSQLVYVSPNKISKNFTWGLNAVLPDVLSADVHDGLGGQVLSSDNGVGDLVAGFFLQSDPVMGPDGPKFVHRFEADVLVPTGDYNNEKSVNPGSNFWSFNPSWAATYWITPRLSTSWRLHYLWNGKNKNPNVSFGPHAQTTQAGQAVHANFAIDYALTPKFRVGLNGYWLQQIEDTKLNGEHLSGTRERVWAIGPGATYSISSDDIAFINLYAEQDAKNRPQGTKLVARFVHHF